MEEAIKDALRSASAFLAEALRGGLVSHGLDADVVMRAGDGRVMVVSGARSVWAAETGVAGTPPTAPVGGIAHAIGGDVAGVFRHHLEEHLR